MHIWVERAIAQQAMIKMLHGIYKITLHTIEQCKFSWLYYTRVRYVIPMYRCSCYHDNPGSEIHGTTMGPTRRQQDPGGPHVGPMNLAIWEHTRHNSYYMTHVIGGFLQARSRSKSSIYLRCIILAQDRYNWLFTWNLYASHFARHIAQIIHWMSIYAKYIVARIRTVMDYN